MRSSSSSAYPARAHRGYIFLVSVLVTGAIASATVVSLMLLGWAAEQNGQLVVYSSRAYEYAHTCAERTLQTLRRDPNYAGSGVVLFDDGSCEIAEIGGNGNVDRTVCIKGESGDTVRRMQLSVARLLPSTVISFWEETASFTLCP